MSAFTGFPDDLFQFLEDISKNNNREWFNANKDRYRESVVAPVTDFIIAMGERLYRISENFLADPRTNGGSMFRIYRDIRFSKDKRPYKENVGCQFRHVAGKSAHAPGFYVHIEPGNIFIGGGIWMPPTPVLNKIRTSIEDHSDEWTKIVTSKKVTRRFSMEGDRLKRPPRGFDPDHPHIEDMKRKSFFLMQKVDSPLILEPEFLEEAEHAFKDAAPLMEFITKAMGLPF